MRSTTRASFALLATALILGCGQAPTGSPAPAETPQENAQVPTPSEEPAAPVESAPAPQASAPAPRPAPARAAAPAPAAAAEPRPAKLLAGTTLDIRLAEAVDSGTAAIGQAVTAEVTRAIVVDGRTIVPRGATVQGEVSEVQPAKRFGGQGKIGVTYNSVRLPGGQTVALEGTMTAVAKSDTAKDTATIAGSAVGGALLGKIIGKDDKDAAIGAAVGGAAGTAVAARKGAEAILEAGTEGTVSVARDATIR